MQTMVARTNEDNIVCEIIQEETNQERLPLMLCFYVVLMQ